jgi:hypothetical protein
MSASGGNRVDLARLGRNRFASNIGRAARGLSAGASNGRDQIHSIRRSDARASTRFVATHCRATRFVHQRERQLTAEHLVRLLAAMFAADVADYSRLTGIDEEGTHVRRKEHLRVLIHPKERGYRVFRTRPV